MVEAAVLGHLATEARHIAAGRRQPVALGGGAGADACILAEAINGLLARIMALEAQVDGCEVEIQRRFEAQTQALRAANAQLEAELDAQRSAETRLQQERDAAEAASRAKSQFLANMSHEIRTPMNGVVGMIELLLATELGPRQRHYAETIQRSGETLLEVIDGILDLSRIEAGRLDIEAVEFDCRQSVRDVVELLGERAAGKGLLLLPRCERDVPAAVVGDPRRVKQVLTNLVGNAIKFTDSGEVRIGLSVAQRQGDTFVLRFEVRDTGMGIAPDSLARLFEGFEQGDGSTRRPHGGAGLGLAIASKLAQVMGGEIGVDSMPGRGSTFWFTVRVPAVRDTKAGEAAPAAELVPFRLRGRVLLAEDNPVNRELAVAMLEAMGLEFVLAVDGNEAVAAMAEGGIDLVLMDCQMPQMDGFDATRSIRAAEQSTGRRTPIVALTANAMEGDRDRCMGCGMDDYLSKPFKPAQLHAILSHWLPMRALPARTPPPPAAADESAQTLEMNALARIRAAGGPDAERLLEKVLRLYCDSVPQMLKSMQEAAGKGDCVALQRAASALKSSSHNVGAVRFTQLCRDLEAGARSGQIRFDRLEALRFEFDSVRRALERAI